MTSKINLQPPLHSSETSELQPPPGNLRDEYLANNQIDLQIEIDHHMRKTVAGNEGRYKQAISMFPTLNSYGITPEHVMAVIRNEISNYDSEDKRQDDFARQGKAGENDTLGYAQISSKGVHELRKEFPQLDKLLNQQGFADNQRGNQGALVTPFLVPYIAAAKLASIASVYERSPQQGIDISPKTIIYGYNADVYFFNFFKSISSKEDLFVGHPWKLVPGMKKVFPGNQVNGWIDEAAEVSTYVDGVFKQLTQVSSPFYLRRFSSRDYG